MGADFRPSGRPAPKANCKPIQLPLDRLQLSDFRRHAIAISGLGVLEQLVTIWSPEPPREGFAFRAWFAYDSGIWYEFTYGCLDGLESLKVWQMRLAAPDRDLFHLYDCCFVRLDPDGGGFFRIEDDPDGLKSVRLAFAIGRGEAFIGQASSAGVLVSADQASAGETRVDGAPAGDGGAIPSMAGAGPCRRRLAGRGLGLAGRLSGATAAIAILGGPASNMAGLFASAESGDTPSGRSARGARIGRGIDAGGGEDWGMIELTGLCFTLLWSIGTDTGTGPPRLRCPPGWRSAHRHSPPR